MELKEACSRSIVEVDELEGSAGVIAINASGDMFQAATNPYLSYAMHDGQIIIFP